MTMLSYDFMGDFATFLFKSCSAHPPSLAGLAPGEQKMAACTFLRGQGVGVMIVKREVGSRCNCQLLEGHKRMVLFSVSLRSAYL